MTTQNAASKKTDEQIHSDAFDEAASKFTATPPGKSTTGEVQENTGGQDQGDNGARSTDNAGVESAVDVSGQQEGREEDGEGSTPDFEQLFKKEQQRNKSWEGRISKAERDAKEARDEADRLRSENATLKGKKPDGKQDTTDNGAQNNSADDPAADLSEEERAALQEVETEYPTLHKALKAHEKIVARKAGGADVSKRVESIESRLSTEDELARESHFSALESAHPGWQDQYIQNGAINEWVESLPYRDAVRAQQILNAGTTDAVISLFDDFAKQTGLAKTNTQSKPNNTPATDKKTKMSNMTAVPRHSGKPSANAGAADKNDFDGAFDEAAAQYPR